MPPGKILTALQASDFGLFGATWWPCAPFPQLRIVTYLVVWLFIWDDEIDLSDGTLWNAFGAAQLYRDQTLAYVRYTLGIDAARPPVTNRIILMFAPIGAAVRERYSLAQRTMFYDEIRYFMEMSEREQRLRLAGPIPALEEFWRYRLGSSAVTVCLALNEFSWAAMELPLEFYADEDVKEIFRCTNTIISATNDLVSIKKEVKRDAIDSLIPIIYAHVGDIQVAVAEVVEFVAAEIRNLDVAAERLFRRYADADEKMQAQVRDFVDGCKYYTTGNFVWSLETDRYDVDYAADGSGDILMTL
ncbi:terpenoid synthase [Mytilinidion resinicola]|uniref:Terpene synthase n=1 Tax=Mytilinidion resinicola TaxID=574789 RepID=A0A6A6Z2W9_9PEZI|nr:terpenoid synthase [Mytilinidion resinicola]KAF2815340.1 terpenoid synthase [Mytilinidion resinicola]